MSTDPPPPSDHDLGLDQFGSVSDEQGLSLEELSRTYAELLSSGDDPYQADVAAEEPEDSGQTEEETQALADDEPLERADAVCEITPRSILEAMLFVGHPQNEPLTSRQVAAQMRGVSPQEVDGLVQELNAIYQLEACPYYIASVGSGYRLQLREDFTALRERFYGRVKEAQLSQTAIEVLSIIAYNQGLTREQVDQLRGKPVGGILSQLVRRQLLRIERAEEAPSTAHYFTTDRFLSLFGLESLDDLPRSHELDRTL